ncbi:MAG: hypothetical protein LBG04_00005, partial [Holosporaceae bacterium]|nr:hypothetical protein [Holosporaceae bacterium]
MQLNEIKFLENVQRIHLKSEELPIYSAITDADVRVKLNKFSKNPRFSVAIDEICANIVGRTMFKVLMTKMKKHHQTMQILEHTDEKYGSYYTK